jgi:hypothetical protein
MEAVKEQGLGGGYGWHMSGWVNGLDADANHSRNLMWLWAVWVYHTSKLFKAAIGWLALAVKNRLRGLWKKGRRRRKGKRKEMA